MPIKYSISDDGHFIHAVASGSVTGPEFVEYEVAHAIDERIKPPIAELLEIQPGALRQVTTDDISKVLERRKESKTWPTPHRCGIVVSLSDMHAWNLAKFYEGMTILHSPEIVIVFNDVSTAKSWLGFNNFHPKKGGARG
ncbi:MAG: hypothetical protein PHV74_02615 [Dehalococcoidia bacterium]|nr:hypothetical protein [Dehalococcoidia bacterium]